MSTAAYLTLQQHVPLLPRPSMTLLEGINRRISHCFSFIRRSESFAWHPRTQPPAPYSMNEAILSCLWHFVVSVLPEDWPSVFYVWFEHFFQSQMIFVLQKLHRQSQPIMRGCFG